MAKVETPVYTVAAGAEITLVHQFKHNTLVLRMEASNPHSFEVISVEVGAIRDTGLSLSHPLPADLFDVHPPVEVPYVKPIKITIRNKTKSAADISLTFYYQYLDAVPMKTEHVERYAVFKTTQVPPKEVRFIICQVPELFAARHVVVDKDSLTYFKFIDIQIGNGSQLTVSEPLEAEALADTDIRFDTAQVMQDQRVIVQNVSDVPRDFSMHFNGVVSTYQE